MKNVFHFSDSVELYQGDCFDILPGLGRFDFLWADPPYNVGKDYDQFDDAKEHQDYMAFISDFLTIAAACSDALAIYPPKIHLREFWNLLPNHHLLIVGFGPSGAVRKPFIHQYVPILVPKTPVKKIPDHWYNVEIPAMGWFYHEKRFNHPAQTSLDLTKRIIEAFTLPGQSIIDPFGGTGTTAIAAIELGRKCTLIEKSSIYCDIAKNRISEFLTQPILLQTTSHQLPAGKELFI